MAAIAICLTQAPLVAQSARATGTIRDREGHPIRGATVYAVHPDDNEHPFITTSDAKGRWAMVGLKAGTYTLLIDAPGFLPARALAVVRTTTATPFLLTLTREPGGAVGPLPSDIQLQIDTANTLRDQGRLDEAIAAYQEIQRRNPTLTSMGFVVAAAYRRKAAAASDVNGRRESLARAIECYAAILAADPGNEQAQVELTRVRAEAGSPDN